MDFLVEVLNLIINGLPSKPKVIDDFEVKNQYVIVLNLIINGLPSKPKIQKQMQTYMWYLF